MEAASEELWEYKVPERRRRTPSPSSSSSRDESTSGQSQESESLPQRRAESYESITPELTSDTGRSRSAVVVMMTSRTPWSISRRRSVGTELVVRVKSIVVEVRCSPNLAIGAAVESLESIQMARWRRWSTRRHETRCAEIRSWKTWRRT